MSGGATVRFLTVFLGFAVGVALFMPWEKLCVRLMEYVDSRLPSLNLTWDDLNRAGPSGFRVDGLVVGFENSPGSMTFEHADIRFGLDPLARVRLNTGGDEFFLNFSRSGLIEFDGSIDLTYLFGRGKLRGSVSVKGKTRVDQSGRFPGTGWVDIRTPDLTLPDGTVCRDVALTAEMRGRSWIVKNISLRKPVDFQGTGVVTFDEASIPDSKVSIEGQIAMGNTFHPYDARGTLGSVLFSGRRPRQ